MKLFISENLALPLSEVSITQIRSQGAGGQNVNKVSSAVHLRFDIFRSSLPAELKNKLNNLQDSRITKNGEIILKAQQHRTYERNREEALQRLGDIIRKSLITQKKRRKTRPSKASQQKRLDRKKRHGKLKQQRKKVL